MIYRLSFVATLCLLAWAAHAVVFNPPMLLTAGSSSVIDLGTASGAGSGAGTAKITIGPGGVPARSTIVVLATPTNPTSSRSVVDTNSNTYTRVSSVAFDSAVLVAEMYVCQVCNPLTAGNTISFPVSAGASIISALAIVTNAGLSLNLNTTPISGGKSTTPSITSGTPSVAGEIFVGGVGYVTTSPATTFIQAAGGWTAPPDSSISVSNQAIAGGWIKNPGTSPMTFNPTLSAANFWGIMLLSFKL